MKTPLFFLVLILVTVAGASFITGCSSPNVVLNALPKDTSVSRLVAGKSVILLVQPNAAPVPDENGYYDNGQGYGSSSGSGGSGNVSGAQMERRKETVNERIMESCDSEIISDGGMVSHQLTDSASSAALLAGNCSGMQSDYALLMNGQVLNSQSSGGGKGGGHHKGGGTGGYPAGGMQNNMPSGTDGSGDSYQQGMNSGFGGGNGGSGTVTFWVTLVRLSDCKKIFLAEAKPDGFKLSDRAESLAQIRSYLKDLFGVEGK